MSKYLKYNQVRIVTLGGVIEIKPSADAYAVSFEQNVDNPPCSYGKTIEEAGQRLIDDLRRKLNAVEEDIRAFIERNR